MEATDAKQPSVTTASGRPTDRQQRAWATAALDALGARGLPPSPPNFAVFFHLQAGDQPAMAQAYAARLDADGQIDQAFVTGLYERLLTSVGEAAELSRIGARFHEAVERLLEDTAGASENAEQYERALSAFDAKVLEATDADAIGAAIADMVEETTRMRSRTRDLERQLADSASEIDTLRRDLDVLRRESRTDPLTGIANRRRFEESLDAATRRARVEGRPLSLLMLDIDHFKRFNDTYGHLMGDQVLKVVARAVGDVVGSGGVPGRFGGEEFAVVLPEVDRADAVTLADRIRETVGGKNVVKISTGERLGSVTLSIGVAVFRPDDSGETLIARADAALYAAKAAGRNQVCAEDAEFGAGV